MEQSFSEYRDKTGVESESDSEVIDNSMVLEDSFSWKKKLVGRSRIVSESEESTDGDSEEENVKPNIPKSVLRRSSVAEAYVISSSEDDASKRGSSCRPSEMSFNKVILSSSEEEEVSPEILPKRRPPTRPKSTESSNSSMIGRKKNKRMILMDSDTENSIVIEHDKHKKIACLKDTPLKIDDGPTKAEFRKATLNDSTLNKSMDETNRSNDEESQSSDEEDESDDEEGHSDDEDGQSCDESGNIERKTSDKGVVSDNDDKKDQFDDTKGQTDDENAQNCDRQSLNGCENDDENAQQSHSDDTEAQSNDVIEESDDGPDEDQMILSRATRMSIMGVIPKGNDTDSDESDFIQSDENSRGSSSTNSLSELPDSGISVLKTPQKPADTSRISCSPIESPLRDITKEFNLPKQDRKSNLDKKPLDDDVTFVDTKNLKQKIMQNFANIKSRKENVVDDDVTIIDSKPEIIALSSDDEEDIPKRSPVIKTSPKPKGESTSRRSKDGTLKPFLPGSYPNQVVYVKRHVRENELNKLERLKEDLHNVKYLLESMDVSTLPDGGVKLMQRLSGLEQQVRQQGDKVASMVLEPDMPSDKDVSRDGFDAKDKALSWDDIQQASNAVQPRMFGKQAMATHMAERNLILERLRDLHASLASRPPESQLAPSPPAVRAQLMPHQLHALAWLRWRETQRPVGGILADDMGLGKTITMIALVVGDKDNGIADDDDNDDEYTGKSSSKLARGGTLVVCPASLIQQWGGEVGKHCVSHAARVCLHHGAARATHPHRIATQDIVVTTYNILQRDHEKNGVLMKILWRRVILDEAHIVRNHKSATSAAVSALRGVRRWCLTGTPVQNKDLDLFALLKFLRCTPFDELTMWKKWIDNKSSGGQERLSTIMRCILLRRTKVQLQQKGQLDCLPERTAHLQEVTLSKEEMNVYQKVLVFSKTLFAQFLHQRAEKEAGDGSMPLSTNDNNAYAKMHKRMIALQGAKPVKSHEILVLLLRLRQVCCHCGLIAAMLDDETAGDGVQEDEAGKDLLAELNKLSLEDSRVKRKSGQQDEEHEEDGVAEEGTTVTEAIRSVLSPHNPVFQLTRHSSKIQAVMQCLKENVFANKGDKAVVVSQWTSVLRLVGDQLAKERVQCVTLSGNVPVPARPPLIQALNDPNNNVRVMLLSLCAGGVGLNLCGANHLLLLDPHWNPQLEEQAQDRIYRVGQHKHVHIYRFMCVGTVEQSIRTLQQTKLELANNVLTGARNNNASKLTIEDLKLLFNMGE